MRGQWAKGCGLAMVLALGCLVTLGAQPDNQLPPGPGGPGGGGGGHNPGQGAAQIAKALKALGLTAQDMEAVRTCVKARTEARGELAKQLQEAGKIARDKNATEEQAKSAVVHYREAMKAFSAKNAAAEKALKEAVNFGQRPKVELALLALGVIDNGLGQRGGQRPPGAGQGGPGGQGGGGRQWGGAEKPAQ